MSNEVVEFIRDVYLEIKAIPSDLKGLINKAKMISAKMEKGLEKRMKEQERSKVDAGNREIVMIKGGNSLLTNLLLLYLCVFHTIGAVLFLAWLCSPEVAYYLGALRNLALRLDDVDAGDRLIAEIERLEKKPETPAIPVIEGDVSSYLVNASDAS